MDKFFVLRKDVTSFGAKMPKENPSKDICKSEKTVTNSNGNNRNAIMKRWAAEFRGLRPVYMGYMLYHWQV